MTSPHHVYSRILKGECLGCGGDTITLSLTPDATGEVVDICISPMMRIIDPTLVDSRKIAAYNSLRGKKMSEMMEGQ